MRLLRPSFFVLLIESGVVSSCTRRIHINYQASKWHEFVQAIEKVPDV